MSVESYRTANRFQAKIKKIIIKKKKSILQLYIIYQNMFKPSTFTLFS